MASSASPPAQQQADPPLPRCLECEAAARRAQQQAADPTSAQSRLLAKSTCKEEYAAVAERMKAEQGQVSSVRYRMGAVPPVQGKNGGCHGKKKQNHKKSDQFVTQRRATIGPENNATAHIHTYIHTLHTYIHTDIHRNIF